MTTKAQPKKILSAKEAAVASEKTADTLRVARETAAKSREQAQKTEALEARRNFAKHLDESVNFAIEQAINKGKKTTDDVWLSSFFDSHAEAARYSQNHPYRREIKKAIKKLGDLDYEVTEFILPSEHYSVNECTGSTTESTSYHVALKLVWK